MRKYVIKTKRLGLRPFQKSDIDYLAELNSDPDVRQFFPDGTQNREQTEARMNDFISYYKEKGLPCFASEVLTTLHEWAKQNINADYIIAFAPVEHIASQRVIRNVVWNIIRTIQLKGSVWFLSY